MGHSQYDEKKEVSYLVLNKDVADKFESYIPQLWKEVDKIILIGDINITHPQLIRVEGNSSKSIELEGGYSFSASQDSFEICNMYFPLGSPYLIKINPDMLDLKIVRYYEKVDLVRDKVVKTLEEEVVYP